MKILYIAHYKESSGWSNAAIQNVTALHNAGFDVVCRDIKLTNKKHTPNEIIESLEKKSLEGVTDCIQQVLPHHICATSKFTGKNVANYVGESMFTKPNPWHVNLNMADEVWVPNDTLKDNTQQFVSKPVEVVPYAFDTSVYQKQYQEIELESSNSAFKFYTIADLNERKNLESIIRCYYHTFKYNENTILILKLSRHNVEADALRQSIAHMCQDIQKQMRMYRDISRYPPIRIMTERISDDMIYSLHKTGNCFVGASHGEGWSIPAFDAMCFGNKPICSDEGGPKMFIDRNNKLSGTLVSGCYNICNQADSAFDHIFTGSELWFCPSEKEISQAMRDAYNNRETSSTPWEFANNYSYDAVAKKIGDLLK